MPMVFVRKKKSNTKILKGRHTFKAKQFSHKIISENNEIVQMCGLTYFWPHFYKKKYLEFNKMKLNGKMPIEGKQRIVRCRNYKKCRNIISNSYKTKTLCSGCKSMSYCFIGNIVIDFHVTNNYYSSWPQLNCFGIQCNHHCFFTWHK